ncbi:DUF1513 domain-containing protein [Amaricoccus macauensis]|uniref:DUF1513 domain-containing protein n=1 Tax=Amaricoccus macauensis TaxID=57001 RepID=UPI003C7E6BCF
MATRRGFLKSLMAATALPALGWADAGSPAYLAAAKRPDGEFRLYGLTVSGTEIFSLPLPTRGHAAAAHPVRPEAVAFARRPGTFAIVLDCISGAVHQRLDAPEGRHFYGHGCFSADGSRLFTAENLYDEGFGRIGVWDASAGYRRIGDFASGGVGPHDIVRLPGTDVMAIANGGIRTHPDTGRAKLNLDTMRPNLSYVDSDGHVLEQIEIDEELHRNSIRHLAVLEEGLVAFAMQWEGDLAVAPPLLGLHRQGEKARVLDAGPVQARMRGYAGSVAFSGDGTQVGITSPRGGTSHIYGVSSGQLEQALAQRDVCGIAAHPDGFLATDGLGGCQIIGNREENPAPVRAEVAWDNHLVKLADQT